MIDIILKIVRMKMVTNIVAGAILFFVLKIAIQWIQQMQNIKRVEKANKKVMTLLKPYAANGKFPAQETIHAVMASVANDYGVEYKDLHSVTYYFQEFIKEILENEYIPSDKKVEYTDCLYKQIKDFEERPVDPDFVQITDPFETKRNTFYRDNQFNICIFLSSLFVALTGILSGMYDVTEALTMFVVVAFSLIVFVDLAVTKKRYKDIPRFLTVQRSKFISYNKERKKRKEEAKKEKEQDQFRKDQKALQEERKKVAEDHNQLLKEKRAFEKEKKDLEVEYTKWNEEGISTNEEQKEAS